MKKQNSKNYMDKALKAFNGQDHSVHFAQVGSLSKPTKPVSVDVEDLVSWITDHKQVTEDFKKHFNIDLNDETAWKTAACSLDPAKWDSTRILGWIEEHKQLAEDFNKYFKVKIENVEGIDCSNIFFTKSR